MKVLIKLLLVTFILFNNDLDEIRKTYRYSGESKELTLKFFDELHYVSENDRAVLRAYKGASIALKARFEKGTKNKTAMFKQGVSYIENALSEAPENIEIRFIRLTIQQNAPKILKYKSNIEEDKNFILNNFSFIKSKSLKNYIAEYIMLSNNFTDEEKNVTSQP